MSGNVRALAGSLGTESLGAERTPTLEETVRHAGSSIDSVFCSYTAGVTDNRGESAADRKTKRPGTTLHIAKRSGANSQAIMFSGRESYSNSAQSGWLGKASPLMINSDTEVTSISSLAMTNSLRVLVHPIYTSALSGLRWLGTFRSVQVLRSRLLAYNILNSDEAIHKALRIRCDIQESEKPTPNNKPAAAVDQELRAHINKLFVRHLSNDGRQVDYQALIEDKEFAEFLCLTRRLRNLDVFEMNKARRLAFFLNIYNALLIHAITIVGRPHSFVARFRLFQTAAYCIGGHLYSLNDIENGVLRGNQPPPYPFASKPFRDASHDARTEAVIDGGDPRIHFGLNCGARSCPPIRAYDEFNVDQALEAATASFIRENVRIITDAQVELSRIFLWYAADFGNDVIWWILKHWPLKTEEDLQRYRRVMQWAETGQLRITYAKYDWSLNEVPSASP
jgi:hypothetical protein